jgi:hypothetical protein
MVVLSSLKGLALLVQEEKDKGIEHPINSAEAAFLCILGDLALATREQYATDEEREMFPIDEENEEEGD